MLISVKAPLTFTVSLCQAEPRSLNLVRECVFNSLWNQ